MTSHTYRGRFAPSPTGPLHFGSLVAAVASYLQAKQQQGQWLIRIEDIDPPREVAGAADDILSTLEQFGFEWDGDILYQHTRLSRYEAVFEQLQQQNQLFACACSRKEIAKHNTKIYPGTCRQGLQGRTARSWRIKTVADSITFNDAIQGIQQCELATDIGDFIVKRADGLYAYQLAVAIDDIEQGITEVVRGYDLLNSTFNQCFLHQCLGHTSPQYAHHPTVLNPQGEKLSKQQGATALDPQQANQLLWQALRFLGQQPPATLQSAPLPELWQWAKHHWKLQKIPKNRGNYVEL